MAIPLTQSYRTAASRGRPPARETLLELFEGASFGISIACLYYRATIVQRHRYGRRHGDALALAKQAARARGAHDVVALIETAEQHNAGRVEVASVGDGHVSTAHEHARWIAGAIEAVLSSRAARRAEGREGR